MLTLVRRARRRLLVNELFSQAAYATSAALLAFILLLLVGTQVLRWQWLVPIPLAAGMVALFRLRRRLPAPYAVAQIVDRRLDLADSLSTALFFSEPSCVPKGSEEMCRLQGERAGQLAQSADVRKAVPYIMPRAVYLTAALVLVASSLFTLRYGLHRSLDLRPPLARILEQTFGFEHKTQLARNAQKNMPPDAQRRQDDNGEDSADQQLSPNERPDDTANAIDDSSQSQSANRDSRKATEAKKQGDEGEKADSGEKDGPEEERDGNENGNSGDNQQGGNQPDRKPDAASRDAGNPGENSSLMSKVKDAMQNLLSRMKPQPGQQGSQQSFMDQKGNQGKAQQNGARQQARDGQPQNGGQQSDAQDGQASDQAQSAQDPQGNGTGKSDTPQASKQPGSGIGSQDGDKNIRQAEQLAAMGKISEIFGKRSATISGESTVEVQSTSQQLHTPYAQRGVQHSQGGAEIHRDEVPVALQAFVAQYFEQVRKQAPPPKK